MMLGIRAPIRSAVLGTPEMVQSSQQRSALMKRRDSKRALSAVSVADSSWLGSYEKQRNRQGEQDATVSNRQKFRDIPIDEQVLEHIHATGVSLNGKGARKKLSARMKRENRAKLDTAEREYPLYGVRPEPMVTFFGYNRSTKASLRAQVSSFDEVPSPLPDEPEVAFAGRSNVGKSSLINCVTVSTAAKKSDRPGKTQSINFHRLAGRLCIVDLPGYGFAHASAQRVAEWNQLMDAYLSGRPSLRKVYVVADARVGLKQADKEMISFLHSHKLKVSIVLNKADALKAADLARMHAIVRDFMASFRNANKSVFIVSASTGGGMQDLAKDIIGLASPDTLKEIKSAESKARNRARIVAERKAASSRFSQSKTQQPAKRASLGKNEQNGQKKARGPPRGRRR